MNEQRDARNRDFKPDYSLLELNDRADWKTARAHYRRLVHLWHPDRYAQRPRERAYAQQQFISLTKSYNNLRTFQRAHGRLPFEPARARTADESMAASSRKQSNAKRRNGSGESGVEQDTRADVIEPGILGRDPGQTVATAPTSGSRRRYLWPILGGTLLLATISVFFVLDRKASQRIIEQGREAVRQAPPSEFMPSAAEIRQSESKGAFVVQPPR